MPIVEPDILIEGAHKLETAALMARRLIIAFYFALHSMDGVTMSATLVKAMMVLQGTSFPGRDVVMAGDIAPAMVAVMRSVVPDHVALIVFLSAGMREADDTRNLDAKNVL